MNILWVCEFQQKTQLQNSFAYFDPHQRTSKMHDPVFNLLVSLLNYKIGLFQQRLFFTSFMFFQASVYFPRPMFLSIFMCLQTDCDEGIVLMNSL